jgi:hypothetical protein
MRYESMFGIATAVAVLGAVALAFSVIGSPAHERALALDRKRVTDLQTLQSRVEHAYWEKELPAVSPDRTLRDPLTAKPYEYRRLDAIHYQLCATFQLPSDKPEEDRQPFVRDWSHRAGRTCYRLGASRSAE